MSFSHRRARLLAALSLTLLLAMLAGAFPTHHAQAATTTTVELEAIADARTQAGSPDVNFGAGFLFVSTLNGHVSFVQFDLLALPANAVIEVARLELNAPTLNDGPNNVEIGRVEGAWDEATLTWNTQPALTWGGPVTNVVGPTLATWNVTALVQGWHSGAAPNFGFSLRGDGGEALSFTSREAGEAPPALVIRYSTPLSEGARPDLGDAPDSSNSLGVTPNTAYPGVPGNFPTVWGSTPAGQPAGPRHNNVTLEAVLGEALSREAEADSGNDEDGPNNILAGGADNADNDRGDDGWRNRTVPFRPCLPTTLTVRVSKAAAATLDRMFLNVWFDGNRDGDWADNALCTPPEQAQAIPATEWLVQDYFVDLTGIAAGGFVDINITTETVLNVTPFERHWMRFTLSEERAVQVANGRADGRGPHPDSAQQAFRFGETEDVLQRSQPPGEDGTLELQKRVFAANQPVPYASLVTYQILLRHNGGTQPVEARIRDALPWPQVIPPGGQYITVESATGGALPLQAQVDIEPPQGGQPLQQVVKWAGTLAPDAEVKLTFQVLVLPICEPNQQTKSIRNLAEAKPVGGATISAEAFFEAQCSGYDAGDLEIGWGELTPNQFDLNDVTGVPLSGVIVNPLPVTVTLGVNLERKRNGPALAAIVQPSLGLVTLGPGERRELNFELQMEAEATDELTAPPDRSEVARLQLCIIPDEGGSCPDRQLFPQLWSETRPVTFTLRPNDLGDAPDSSNHAGAAMTAFPGVQASYPTVFDPATGLPEGPRHAAPRPFHLGERVSREAEADVGPDQDPANNIEPAANVANLDRADDGSRLGALADCQPTTAEVLVAVSPQAWNYFTNSGQKAYLNVWIDSNRDGDWADGFSCQAQGQAQNVVEHILIDAPIDVAALGPGLHPLSLATARVPWPAQLAQRPSWVRFTLSERPSNKTLSFGTLSYGDGRGFATPFQTGETEDHLLRPQAGEGAGPDMGLHLGGKLRVGGQGEGQVVFKLDYANQGSQPATGAVITFTKPEQLRDLEIVLLQAPGIPPASITQSPTTVTIALPSQPVGATGNLLLGWNLPAPGASLGRPSAPSAPSADAARAELLAAAEAYRAEATVALSGDVDPSNNQATATVTRGRRAPIMAAVAGDGTLWGRADSTCRNSVALVGKGEPNSIIAILIGLLKVGEVTTDGAGNFSHTLTNLAEGRQRIQVAYELQSPRDQNSGLALDVDTSLPVDPLSLSFTDSKGRTLHPQTLGWSFGASQSGAFLRAGERYEVGINSCVDDPNQRITLALGDTTLRLRDDDGDGRYTGSIEFGAGAALAASGELRITVASGASVVSLGSTLGTLAPGVVRDSESGAPLAGASVTALAAQGVEGGGVSFGPWPAAALGQPNPQTTGADGAFSFVAPDDAGRVEVRGAGFQSYRSWAGQVRDIRLTKAPAGAATHTVLITENGFVPAVLRVAPGSVVEWVNADLAEHTATGERWDSGALAPGERYVAAVGAAGVLSYGDAADPLSRATIIVEGGGFRLHLPLVRR